MPTREEVADYLATLDFEEMTDLCNEVLQRGWVQKMVPDDRGTVTITGGDRMEVIRTMRDLGMGMKDAKDVADNLPWISPLMAPYYLKNYSDVCIARGVDWTEQLGTVPDEWDRPPTINPQPMG